MYTTIVHYPNISSNEIASISLETLVSYLRGFCLFHFTLFSQTDRNFFFFNVCSFILQGNYSMITRNPFASLNSAVIVEFCCELNKICIKSNMNML